MSPAPLGVFDSGVGGLTVVRALRELAQKIEAGKVIRRVMVETTGLADPAPILQTLMSDPLVLYRYRLDGVVTLVDAVNAAATLDSQVEAVKQVAMADRLVITKTDIANAGEVGRLQALLREMNPYALVSLAVDGMLDPDLF